MMKYKMNTLKHNMHERDKNILFFEEGHKYKILTDPDSKYTSVTTWNHSHFEDFDADDIINKMMKGKKWKEGHKYWGQSPEQIKQLWNTTKEEAATSGTSIHFQIECFMNNPEITIPYTHKELYENYMEKVEKPLEKEWEYFIQFIKETPDFKPYRTEWMIYHEELKLSGSIDMVYENSDGTLSIYDWKRSKEINRINRFNKYAVTPCISHLFDANFWHYSLQLNTYKAILEAKYDKKVRDLYLVRLHPNEETYDLIELPNLKTEMEDLFKERKRLLDEIA